MATGQTSTGSNRGVLALAWLGIGSFAWGAGSGLLQPETGGTASWGLIGGIGLILASLSLWFRSRPADQLWVEAETWTVDRNGDRVLLQATFVARNLNPALEVTLAQVNPRLHVLSQNWTEELHTLVRLRSKHEDLPPRFDNYWQAYIISPQSQTHLELEVEISGLGLDHLESCWVELDYIQYGRQLRTPKTAHLIVPLKEVSPASEKTEVNWQDRGSARLLPIRTHLLHPLDQWDQVIQRYVSPLAQSGDIVAISETAAAIVEGHFRHPTTVQPGWIARRICYLFPSKTSLSSAYGMQVLIDNVGVWRVLGALVIGSATKLAGISGTFYALAGEQAALIDDVTGSLPPYDQFIVLGPRDPQPLVDQLQAQVQLEIAIVDANDLGEVKILAATPGVKPAIVEEALRKNPAGNSAEQTPIVLIRPNGNA